MSLTLSSCAPIPIKDSEWCGDLGVSGASCFHTLKPDSRDLTKEQWDAERIGQVCTTAKTFSEWKAALEKLCSESHRCVYRKDVQPILDKFMENVKRVEAFSLDAPHGDVR